MISIKNVSKTFRNANGQVEALKEINLEIGDGDIFGIIGLSGAGKSTLVRCINLLERPNVGTVTVGGVEMTGLPEKELRAQRMNIGMIFQGFNLMPSRTVFDNIAYPLKKRRIPPKEIQKRVRELLALVDISEKEKAYPSQLSGGQKQRVAIARAIAGNPKVLLCDEATSALDPQTTVSILKLLKKINQSLGITIVIITHEMAVVKQICSRVAVMEGGRITEQGEVLKLFSDPQAEVTKAFVKTSANLGKIRELIEEESPLMRIKDGERIVMLHYLGGSADKALISEVARKFGVDGNIIFGSIDIIEDSALGTLVVILGGERENIDRAIAFMKENKVFVEVLKQ